MLIPKSLKQELEDITKSKIATFSSCAVDCVNQVGVITLENKQKVFLKWNDRASCDFFSAESHGLKLLGEVNGVTVPNILHVGESYPFIVLEYLPADDLPGSQSLLGQTINALHSVTSLAPGLEIDNYLGLLPQQNRVSKQHRRIDWVDFFVEYRLKPQAVLGEQNSWFTWDFAQLFNQKHSNIIEILKSGEQEFSLLHGDLWSGNVHWSSGKPYLIDPAVYYGSREADIAFMSLFGSLDPEFFEAYDMPLADGFEVRKHVLNLYHLMNHANIFGGQYVETVWSILEAL